MIPFCERLWSIDNRYPHYNKHDLNHSKRIEIQLDKWLSNRIWSENEAIILLLGIYLHDMGMNSDKIKDYTEGESPPFYSEKTLEKIRMIPGKLSSELIDEILEGKRILIKFR